MMIRLCPLPVSCLAVFCSIAGALQAAEGIQFSRPDVEFSAPQARNPNLPPTVEFKSLDLGNAQPPRAYVPPPQVRPEPRRIQKKTLFDEPSIFADPTKEKEGMGGIDPQDRVGPGSNRRFETPRTYSASPNQDPRKDREQRALSPVEDLDWTPQRDRDTRDKFSVNPSSPFGRNQATDSKWAIAAPIDDDNRFEAGATTSLFGRLNSGDKHEWSREQMKMRSEFEKLLGAQGPGLTRTPQTFGDSLEPITSPFATPKSPAAPLHVPAPAAPEPLRSLDPMQAYADQQKSWRGPTMDDLNRKHAGPGGTQPAQPVVDPTRQQQRPLMSQPTMLEFPTRKF